MTAGGADSAIAAIVFDFDGLLMDTETTSLASWRYEWSQWGLELDESHFFVDHGGDTTAERYAQLANAVGTEYNQLLSHERRTAYRETRHLELDLAPGIAAWIDEARSSGLRLAVASSSPADWVTKHLHRVGRLESFETLACGDDVDAHKPAPDVYRLALQHLGVDSDNAVAVEDTPHGVASARAAGLRCIAIPSPYFDHARFEEANLVLDSAEEMSLREALSRLGH